MTTLNPYLIFDGNCEKAFEFYKSVFGGEFTAISRFKDAPLEAGPMDINDAEKIMHISLPVGDSVVLMGSDSPESKGRFKIGNNVFVSIDADDEGDAKRIFKELSDGGEISMPLGQTFWGALFGMVCDKYGINWMVSCDYKQ